MKYRNTLIAFVALAALIALAYYVSQPENAGGTPTPTVATEAALTDVDAKDVARIEVTTPFSRTVLRRDGDVWFIDEPTKEEADTERLNETAGTFAKVRATRTLTDTPANLAPFGLVTGTMTLTLRLKDDSAQTLRFGNPIVGTGAYYAQKVGDARVHLVNPFVYGEAQRLLTLLPKKPTPTPVPPTPTATPESAGPAPAPTATETPRP